MKTWGITICIIVVIIVVGFLACDALADGTYADNLREAARMTIDEGKKGNSGNFIIGCVIIGVVIAGTISLFSGK